VLEIRDTEQQERPFTSSSRVELTISNSRDPRPQPKVKKQTGSVRFVSIVVVMMLPLIAEYNPALISLPESLEVGESLVTVPGFRSRSRSLNLGSICAKSPNVDLLISLIDL